jgi:hypothetical protein
MTDCIDLLERFGEKFKIVKDESYQGQYGPNAWTHDPWYHQIRCRLGHIFPHGGSTLAVSLDRHPKIAKRLAALNCCRVYQHGDDGMTLLFDVTDFKTVAKIVKPHRRAQLSEARKAELREQCQQMRARKGQDGLREEAFRAPESPIASQQVSEAMS